MTAPLTRIPVGVAVERRKAESPWLEEVWRAVSVFAGVASAAPWTIIDAAGGVTTFYAGDAAIELYRTETANYRSNLAAAVPLVWVILRPRSKDPAFDLLAVTADPAEGEALTGAGSDLVEAVPMAASIREQIQAFIDEHHIDRPHFKRQRDRTGASRATHVRDAPESEQ
jgi:hypothetical protein